MNEKWSRGPLAALLTLCFLLQPAILAASEASDEMASISGQVRGRDGRTPAVGAVVRVYHLSSERTFSSSPTTSNGKYEIPGLPYGYYDIAVEIPDGMFVADQVANVPPAGKVVLMLSLADFVPGAESDDRRSFPGSDTEAAGVARVTTEAGKGSFWRRPAGIGVLVGGGGAALLAIASGGSNNNQVTGPPVSPASPGE